MKRILSAALSLFLLIGCSATEQPLTDYSTKELEKLKDELFDEMEELGKDMAKKADVAQELELKEDKKAELAEVDGQLEKQGQQYAAILARIGEVDAVLATRDDRSDPQEGSSSDAGGEQGATDAADEAQASNEEGDAPETSTNNSGAEGTDETDGSEN